MKFPANSEIEEALKRILIQNGNRPLTAARAYEQLADYFKLSPEHCNAKTKNAAGQEYIWHYRCRSARKHLVDIEVLNRHPRDRWCLTPHALKGLTSSAEDLGL